MKEKILILSGDGGPATAAANIYYEYLSNTYDIEVVEETITLTTIFSFLKKKLFQQGPLYVLNFILLRLYKTLFLKKKSIVKTYTPDLVVTNINNDEVIKKLEESEYTYLITNACSILKKETIQAAKTKILNLHNGVNPLYRGIGNIWAYHENNLDFVGTSVHFLDEGVDTGELISIIPLRNILSQSSFEEIDITAFEEGAKEISNIIQGKEPYGIPERYKQIGSRCYSYPGLSHYLLARKNFYSQSNKVINDEKIWRKSFVDKAQNQEGNTLEQQHWTKKDIVDWHDNVIIKRVNEMENCKVLDIGCGDARHAERIINKEFYIGVDYSFDTIRINKSEDYQKNITYDFPLSEDIEDRNYLAKQNVILLENWATKIPIKDQSVNLILAIGLFQHLDDVQSVITEMKRCLSSRGTIIINTLREFSKIELLLLICAFWWKKDMRELLFSLYKKEYGTELNGTLLARRYSKSEIQLYLKNHGIDVKNTTQNGILGTNFMARELILEAQHV